MTRIKGGIEQLFLVPPFIKGGLGGIFIRWILPRLNNYCVFLACIVMEASVTRSLNPEFAPSPYL